MDKTIKNEREFMATLDDAQRAFFVKREEQRAIQLQRSLLDLSRGMSVVGALNGEALAVQLAIDS